MRHGCARVHGSGNNRGAIAGAILVWGLWALTAAAVSAFVPPEEQARAAALQIVAIGVGLCLMLLLRPRGLFGEVSPLARLSQGKGGDAPQPHFAGALAEHEPENPGLGAGRQYLQIQPAPVAVAAGLGLLFYLLRSQRKFSPPNHGTPKCIHNGECDSRVFRDITQG